MARLQMATHLALDATLLILIAGCPTLPPVETCTSDAQCDDGVFCNGAESCDPDGLCRAGTAPCTAEQTCQEAQRRCDDCATDGDCGDDDPCTQDACLDGRCASAPLDCDDGDACTADACDAAAGGCTHNAIDCDDGDACTADVCDPAAGCTHTAIDCDDDDLCTTDTCDPAAGCIHEPTAESAACDDGLFCNGAESCDPATGDCAAGTPPCAEDEACDEEADTCMELPPCTVDADCRDDLFCNGEETCDEAVGVCRSGEPPCAYAPSCNEATDRCRGWDFEFTLGKDTLEGAEFDDTASARLIFNAPTGTSLASLQTGDSLDLRGGIDTLEAALIAPGPSPLVPTLTSVELLLFSLLGNGALTVDCAACTGTTDITVRHSTNPTALTISNVSTLVNVALAHQAVGATIAFLPAATAGNADTLTLTVSGVTGGAFQIVAGAANGVESLHIVANAPANTLGGIVQTNAATLETVTVAGAAALTITSPLPSTVLSVNASSAGGGVSVSFAAHGVPVSFTGGGGNDSVVGSASADRLEGGPGSDTLTGGAGADLFPFRQAAHFGDVLVDFTPGTDRIDLSSTILDFAGIAGTSAVPAVLTAAHFETARTGLTDLTAGDQGKIVRLTAAQTTTALSTSVFAAVGAYVLAIDSTLERGVLYYDDDWSTVSARALVARFDNVTTLDELATLTFTDFAEID